ncbi:MAG: vWA domain-containing protein [Bacteroidota bacterium]
MRIQKLLPFWLLLSCLCIPLHQQAKEELGPLHSYLNHWITLSEKVITYQEEIHTYYQEYSIYWHARLYQEKMKGGLAAWEHDEAYWESWSTSLSRVPASPYMELQQQLLEKGRSLSHKLATHSLDKAYLKEPHLETLQELMQQWDGLFLDVQESTRQHMGKTPNTVSSKPEELNRLLSPCMRSCEALMYAIASAYSPDIEKESEKLQLSLNRLKTTKQDHRKVDTFVDLMEKFLKATAEFKQAAPSEERYGGSTKSQFFIQTTFLPLFSQREVNIQQLYAELTDGSTISIPYIPVPEIFFPPLRDASTSNKEPIHWLWLVDVSESMQEEKRLITVENWLRETVANQGEADKLSLLSYREETQLHLDYQNPALAAQANLWKGMQTGGKGNLKAALAKAIKLGTRQKNLPTHILLCTDGGFGIDEPLIKLAESAQLSGLALSILLTDKLTYEREQAIHKIARIGGGNLILLYKE